MHVDLDAWVETLLELLVVLREPFGPLERVVSHRDAPTNLVRRFDHIVPQVGAVRRVVRHGAQLASTPQDLGEIRVLGGFTPADGDLVRWLIEPCDDLLDEILGRVGLLGQAVLVAVATAEAAPIRDRDIDRLWHRRERVLPMRVALLELIDLGLELLGALVVPPVHAPAIPRMPRSRRTNRSHERSRLGVEARRVHEPRTQSQLHRAHFRHGLVFGFRRGEGDQFGGVRDVVARKSPE